MVLARTENTRYLYLSLGHPVEDRVCALEPHLTHPDQKSISAPTYLRKVAQCSNLGTQAIHVSFSERSILRYI